MPIILTIDVCQKVLSHAFWNKSCLCCLVDNEGLDMYDEQKKLIEQLMGAGAMNDPNPVAKAVSLLCCFSFDFLHLFC